MLPNVKHTHLEEKNPYLLQALKGMKMEHIYCIPLSNFARDPCFSNI